MLAFTAEAQRQKEPKDLVEFIAKPDPFETLAWKIKNAFEVVKRKLKPDIPH